MTKVALCCIGKCENKYIVEFLSHYKRIGFSHVYLYDNNDIDGERFEDVVKDFIDEGFITLVDYRGRKACQFDAYNDCYEKITKDGKYEWVAFFDCDEFLTLVKHENISDFIEQKCFNDTAIIHVNWMCYGSNGKKKYEDKPVQERFPDPIMPLDFKKDLPFSENCHIKSIIRRNMGIKFTNNPHTPTTPGIRSRNASGILTKSYSPWSETDFTTAYLKHYVTKSYEEWIWKVERGYPDNNVKKKENINKEFNQYNKCQTKTLR